jgi:hypothetical protein
VNFIVFDTHSPLLNIPFFHALIQHMRWHRSKGNKVNLFHGGDVQDNSALSRHPKTKVQMLMERQFNVTRAMITSLFQVIDDSYFVRGNHDDWFARLVDGTLGMGDYWSLLFSGLDKHKVNHIDDTKLILHNCGSLWRISHSINYSTIAGRNANRLANKFDSNIITGHEHSLAVLRDDNNRNTVIACGMMADYALMNYVHDYDTKHNIMKNAYVVVQNGTFEIMTPYPDWQDWQKYGVDPLAMYEYENQKQQVLMGKLDLMRWLDDEGSVAA